MGAPALLSVAVDPDTLAESQYALSLARAYGRERLGTAEFPNEAAVESFARYVALCVLRDGGLDSGHSMPVMAAIWYLREEADK